MRTDRALDRLRTCLARRGFTSSATALAALVGGQPLVSAPAGLAAALVSQVLASAATGIAVPTLFAVMNTKLTATALVAAAAFFLLGRYAVPSAKMPSPMAAIAPVPTPSDDSQRTITKLQAENTELRQDVDRLTAASKHLIDSVAAMPRPAEVAVPDAAAQQRQQMLSNLRQIGAATDQFMLENRRAPTSLDEIVGPTKYIKSLRVINGEDYTQLSLGTGTYVLNLPDGSTVSYLNGTPPNSTSGQFGGGRGGGGQLSVSYALSDAMTPELQQAQVLRQKITPAMNKALQAYQAANGHMPAAQADLTASYFDNPQDAADFAEAVRLMTEANAAARRSVP